MKIKNNTQFSSIIIIIITLLSAIASSAAATSVEVEVTENQVDQAIENALDYLRTQQNVDGGFRWFDESSNVPTTIRIVLATAASGFSKSALSAADGNQPIDYLFTSGPDWIFQVDSDDPGLNLARAGQLLTAVAAANQNPHDFGPEPIDLIYLIQSEYQQDTGVFGTATQDNVLDQVWAILGLAAAQASIPDDAVTWLINAQNSDGSWDDGFGSFLDTTPLAVMAVAAADQESLGSPAVQSALDFMLTNQQPDGGWQTEWDSATNANTTGMMLQALLTTSLNDPEMYVAEIANARLAILNIQQENGMIGGDFANAYSTAEALLGLADQPLYNLGTLRRVSQAFDFILNAQSEDGGWGSVGLTIDVILALTAAGWDPLTVQQNGNSPIDFLVEDLAEYLESGPDAIGKSILGLVAARQDPSNFNGIDLTMKLMETYDPDITAFGDPDNTWHQSLALLGLYAGNQPIPEGAVQALIELQNEDGGWEYLPGFGTTADNTALALQALLAAGKSIEDEIVQNSLDHIQTQQLADGGWGDSSTTAFAIMALNSLGLSPSEWITENHQSPLENIFTFQDSSGGFYFSSDFPEPNTMSTIPAVLAVVSSSYLISPMTEDSVNNAGLIIYASDVDIEDICVSFTTPTISGFELLDNSEISYDMQDGFLNSIKDIANPSGGTMYWSYWRWNGREWQFNNKGASDSVVYPGSIEAWMFTSWEVFPSLPPNYTPNLNQTCDQRVLRNFSDQPFLNFYTIEHGQVDLVDTPVEIEPVVADETIEDAEEIHQPAVEDPTEPVEEPHDPAPVEISQDAEESPRSVVPVIIIGVAGVLVILTIIAVVIKKK